MRLLFLMVMLFLQLIAYGQLAFIKGSAAEYAGQSIEIVKQSNIFTRDEVCIGRCVVGDNGDFNIDVRINEACQVSIPLGVYRGSLFIEPNKTYTVSLPKMRSKTEADNLNPYFRQTELNLNIDSMAGDLNKSIREFDELYYGYIDERFKLFFLKNYKKTLEADIVKMDSVFASNPSVYFRDYRNFRYVALRYSSYLRDKKMVIENYFSKSPVLVNNPAYVELFHQLFDNYILSFEGDEESKVIEGVFVGKEHISKLDSLFGDVGKLGSDMLREIVILKCLYESYYNGYFPKENTLYQLNLFIRTTGNERLKNSAIEIRNKFTNLMTGQAAPLFTLKDKENKEISLSDFEEKFVYLNFCNTKSYACLEQLKLLKELHDKKGEFVEIVTISVDAHFNDVLMIAEKEEYNWTFLHYANQIDVVAKYEVYSYPTYYLINPEGKLVLSPAPSPKENFNEQFAEIWIARERERIRNGGKEPKTKKDIKQR